MNHHSIQVRSSSIMTEHTAQQIEDRLFAYRSGHADNTNRAREADYRIFKQWCDRRGVLPIPSSPEQIELFLWESVQQPKVNPKTGFIVQDKKGETVFEQRRAVSTIERYLATIKYLHDVAFEVMQDLTDPLETQGHYKNPADTRRVRIAMRAIKLRYRSKMQKQAAPIRLDLLDTILDRLGDSLRDTLYKALVSVGFDTLMRRSELVAIEIQHISYDDDGCGNVFVPFHKSDQLGDGGYRYLSATSVRLIHDWITKAHIHDGLLFRSVDSANLVLDAMHVDRVAKIYKNLARRCNVRVDDISAHSTRVGAAQELLSSGVSMPELMVAGDWKSPAMPVRYAKKINTRTGAMANLSRAKGRS